MKCSRFSPVPSRKCWHTISNHVTEALRLVAGLSPRKSGFCPRPVHAGIVVAKVALRQVFLRVLLFSLVSTIPTELHPHISLIYNLRYPYKIRGNKRPTLCNRLVFLLQNVLFVQHVSSTIMPIIRSSRVIQMAAACGTWRFGLRDAAASRKPDT